MRIDARPRRLAALLLAMLLLAACGPASASPPPASRSAASDLLWQRADALLATPPPAAATPPPRAAATASYPSPETGPARNTPQVDVRRRVERYPVEGASGEALLRSLQTRGPIATGSEGLAYTRTSHRWHYRYAPVAGRCVVSAVRVEHEVLLTLPDWTPPRGASAALVAEWDRFLAALQRHEEGHARRGREAADAIAVAISATTTATCADFPRAAEAAAEAEVARERAWHAAYDQTTGHGRDLGAVFLIP